MFVPTTPTSLHEKAKAMQGIYEEAKLRVLRLYGAEPFEEKEHIWFSRRPTSIQAEIYDMACVVAQEWDAFWSTAVFKALNTLQRVGYQRIQTKKKEAADKINAEARRAWFDKLMARCRRASGTLVADDYVDDTDVSRNQGPRGDAF